MPSKIMLSNKIGEWLGIGLLVGGGKVPAFASLSFLAFEFVFLFPFMYQIVLSQPMKSFLTFTVLILPHPASLSRGLFSSQDQPIYLYMCIKLASPVLNSKQVVSPFFLDLLRFYFFC